MWGVVFFFCCCTFKSSAEGSCCDGRWNWRTTGPCSMYMILKKPSECRALHVSRCTDTSWQTLRRCDDVDGQGDAWGPSSIWPPDPKTLRLWRKQPAVLFFPLDLCCVLYTHIYYKKKDVKNECNALCVSPLFDHEHQSMGDERAAERVKLNHVAWQRPVKPQTSSMSSTRLCAIINLSLLVRHVLHLPGK